MRSTIVSIGLAVTILGTTGHAGAGRASAAALVAPSACVAPLGAAIGLGVTSDGVRRGVLTMFGISVRIHPASIDLSISPVAAPPWKLWYHGLSWLVPLAVESFASGDESGRRLVAAYIAAAVRTSPDPGSATPAALARAKRTGWDEGANTRRQQSPNCLVQMQPDARVRGLLNATIRTNVDPRRYFGRPLRNPHNHGLIANRALIDSGVLLVRPGLIDIAARRLTTDVRFVRDRRCGMTLEQSAPYHGLNARLWSGVAARLAAVGRPLSAAVLRAAASQMAIAHDHLVTPGGTVVSVGDGNPMPGFQVGEHRQTHMLCRAAGWAAGRGAWRPATFHYTLRFGPRASGHGHSDHGSVTWWAGEDVLIDPGTYWNPWSGFARWARSNAAHNVLDASGIEFSGATALVRATWRPGGDSYTVRDGAAGVTRTRSVRIDRTLPLLMVLDRVTSVAPRTFSQRWHLARGWLRTTTSGSVRKGSMTAGIVALDLRTGRMLPRLMGTGWVFPNTRTVTRGLVLSTRTTGRSAAIFTVVYRGPVGARPVLTWRPGSVPGTGTVRVWWGRAFRDVRIDRTGILPA